MNKKYTTIDHELPLIPLRGLSIFPYMILNFDIGREKSLKALEEAMLDEEMIFLTSQKDAEVEDPDEDEFYHVGTISKIKQMIKLPGDAVRVLVEGLSRGRIKEVSDDEGYYRAVVEELVEIEPEEGEEIIETDVEEEALLRNVMNVFEDYINIGNKISPELMISLSEEEDYGRVVDTIAANIYLKNTQKQEILEEFDVKKRMELIYSILLEEIEIMKIEKKITLRVKRQMNKVQKDYYLREQLRAIQKELGEDEDVSGEALKYREQLVKMKAPKATKEKIQKEIEKFERMSPASPDSAVSRNYLNTIFSLPWNKESKEKLDIAKAEAILNEDHYGLDKVKERILEYLAVRKLARTPKGPIICLVGPPGVGKTSIVKSVARSLGRQFVRLSLGGVRDEAEIRGHRRTYIGAIPGRIINGMKEAGTKNPVFLLDEIDKMASDYKGDPASAMLEVLDPEQNKDFVDHYMEIPFDLSKVLFITTANSLDGIPGPLLDRMEVIRIAGYTEEEKLKIAQRYLLSKQIKENALPEGFVTINEEVMKKIVTYYTREAGVRGLERTIGKVCRKVARKYVEDPSMEGYDVQAEDLEKFLGKEIFRFDLAKEEPRVGLVTGLAWTAVGGVTLEVEVNVLKGKGEIVLTGQLGDVMKESARTAISYIRSVADSLGIEEDFYKTKDIHIHLPEGATPKDGPSAGITMALAVISALTGRGVPGNIAMTGEITLRGRVLAVGGVKEKLLAAHRAGITKALLPEECKADLDEIPDNVKKDMEFVLVETMDDVLREALV
ncbi:endopeptidase La [Peptacetobacter hominis]|uniref:Lon protease n=1 Tax=Peptacetobacter hominis TaxID=2743610 RepID=A0A544QXJ8_9FIRM|nr:endopeptidase La [Peptacetobacter hominis]TQQ85459.1 endopeptidase La [Peptacetobacter hominis]